jgi:hypothetical protein
VRIPIVDLPPPPATQKQRDIASAQESFASEAWIPLDDHARFQPYSKAETGKSGPKVNVLADTIALRKVMT